MRTTLTSTIAVTSMMLAADTQAQDGVPFDLGTVVLEGERVERTVFDTESSVYALGSDDIAERPQVRDVEGVLLDVPNVLVFGSSNEAPTIRGQQTLGPLSGGLATLSGSLPRATISVDGRALGFNEYVFGSTSIWDVDTIEVFRGPQTTSQGANSIAGAIYVRTNDPVFKREFAFRGETSSFDGYRFSVMANTPLSDSVAARLAFDDQRRDTFIDYETPGQQLVDGVDQFTSFTGRASLLWQPVEIPELSMQLTYARSDADRPQTENVDLPFEDLTRTSNVFPPTLPTQSNSLIWETDYAFSDTFSLRNTMTFSQYDAQRNVAMSDQGQTDIDGEDFSNEVVLDFGSADGRLTGVTGVYLRQIDEETEFRFAGADTFLHDEKTSIGVFLNLRYELNDQWDVGGGARLQRDRQVKSGSILTGSTLERTVDFDETFEAVLPSISIGFEPNEDLRFSFLASKGYNPGGLGVSGGILFNAPGTDPVFLFDQEEVWTYELGARANLLKDTLTLTANIFYSDFRNAQRSIVTNITGFGPDEIVRNAESAESYGLELYADYRPSDRLKVTGGLGLLHTELNQFDAALSPITGNDFAFAPEVTASFGLDYEVVRNLMIGGQIRFNSGYYSDDANTGDLKVDDFTIVDLRASYALANGGEIYGYINNVSDRIAATNIIPGGTVVASTTKPREIGIGATYRW
ncbi:TonB-dependent receptor [Actibacterium sp. 188UL27-1]|uniref:TonB-dependent receptor n=1 Tax=Actibacterium sp. 188UL27-1 TaxID=2786961 RepID=UPI0019590697|nr:TonB-dependent receptor [Actibacterium sp. 188UL27-1]MBM7069713.1 TonB-dependent receptor [Actibacterium sp. 188UL27-1]